VGGQHQPILCAAGNGTRLQQNLPPKSGQLATDRGSPHLSVPPPVHFPGYLTPHVCLDSALIANCSRCFQHGFPPSIKPALQGSGSPGNLQYQATRISSTILKSVIAAAMAGDSDTSGNTEQCGLTRPNGHSIPQHGRPVDRRRSRGLSQQAVCQ